MRTLRFLVWAAAIFMAISCRNVTEKKAEIVPARWSVEQANAWQAENGWLRGSNFNPSTAINQLENWQAET